MRTIHIVGVVMLFCALGRAQEWQSWDEVDLTATWDKVSVLVPSLVRVDNRLPNPQFVATGLTGDFSLPWHLTLTGGYLFADLPQRSLTVHVPLVAVTKSFQFHGYTVTDRNRLEKLIGYGDSPVRYRNRLMLDRPMGHAQSWHVFADDEIFFDLTARSWNQNRFQAGTGARISSSAAVDVYYLLRNASGGAPLVHVAGVTLKIAVMKRGGK